MKAEHPGAHITAFLGMFGITRKQLAAHLGCDYVHLTQVINGIRPVGNDLAMLLAQTFSTSEEYWVFAQAVYDLQRRKELLENQGLLRKVKALPLPEYQNPRLTKNDRCLCGHFAWDHVTIPDGSCWCGCPLYLRKEGYLAARRRGDISAPQAPTETELPAETELIDEDP